MMVSSNSHTQVSNRKQGMQIPFCNFPMQIPMQISNANFLCNSLFAISNAIVNANFQCKFLMQFPMQISNANFQCKFHLQFSLHFSMQSPLHTCLQNKYTGAARQRRDKSFASSRPARCIGGVLPGAAGPPLAQLQDAPVQCHPPPPAASATAAGSASNSSVRRLQQQCEESSTPTAV